MRLPQESTLTAYFETLSSNGLSTLVGEAERSVCLATPGLHEPLAEAIIAKATQIGADLITVCVDFDERVLRMGFGSLSAIQRLRQAGISVTSIPGLRMGLLVSDDRGFAFAPTALLLEGEKDTGEGMNAMRLLPVQAKEAMARLSPAAKAVAMVLAKTDEERKALEAIPVENTPKPVAEEEVRQVSRAIEVAPLVKFDVARQVRVYNAFLQYVKISLKNASIDRKRVSIPASILDLGGADSLDGRLKATFDLIEKTSSISSKPLTDKVEDLRKSYTRSINGDRVILKLAKDRFEKRVNDLRAELEVYQAKLEETIGAELLKSKEAIINFYEPVAKQNPPEAAHGLFGSDVRAWLSSELDRSFPTAKSLVSKMVLDVDYKDVTYETLRNPKFLEALRRAFPNQNWEQAHEEFQAAGETK